MTHRQFVKIRMRCFRRVIREKVRYLVVQGQKPFADRKPDCRRGKAFADGIHRVLCVCVKRLVVPLYRYFPVPQNHQAVKFKLFALNILNKLFHHIAVNADVFRGCRTRQICFQGSCRKWHLHEDKDKRRHDSEYTRPEPLYGRRS